MMPSFGQRVRALRTAAQMTQQELADAAGFSRTSITNIEGDRQDVPLSGIHAIADALEIAPATLFDNETPSVPAALLLKLAAEQRRAANLADNAAVLAGQAGQAAARVEKMILGLTEVTIMETM